jgi:glycosyltransferase involved in cell wall biosynthesis
VYTGSFYDARRPLILWQALWELIEEGKINPQKITVNIYGRNTNNFVLGEYQDNLLIQKIVHFYGYTPHTQIIKILLSADVLLLYSGFGNTEQLNSPAKLFEYLRSGKPVFAIIDPESSAAEILLPANTIFLANSASLSSIKNTLSELYTQWEEGKLKVSPDWEYIKNFERKALTARLAEVLSSIT